MRHHHARRTSGLRALLAVCFALPTLGAAHANDGNTTVSMARGGLPPTPLDLADLMPADIDSLIVAPNIARVLADIANLNQTLTPFYPEWGREGLTGVVLRALATDSSLLSGSNDHLPKLKRLLLKEGLADAGIDPLGALVLSPDLDARVLMVAFELVDRPQFERWLARIEPVARKRIQIGGEVATVVGPQNQRPVTCLARRAYALCQVGVPAVGDPVQPLRRLSALRGPRLGDTSSRKAALQRAMKALPPGAHLYAAADTHRLAPRLGRLIGEWETRVTRFAEKDRQRKGRALAAHLRKKLAAASKLTDGLALGIYVDRSHTELRWQANLTAYGRELLAWWLPSHPADSIIERWTRTPALVRMVARTRAELLEGVAMSFGWSVPKAALSGELGMLSMGLHSLCELAMRRHEASRVGDGTHWGFVFHTAVALGLRTKDAADRIHRDLSKHLEAEPALGQTMAFGTNSTPQVVGPAATARVRLRGNVGGHPYKVQVLDRLMVLGMGPGSASAALRRLGAMPAPRPPPPPAPFLEIAFNPRMIDAAFASGNIGPAHRASLRTLDKWRLRFRPLLARLREIRLTGQLDPNQGRVVLRGIVAE